MSYASEKLGQPPVYSPLYSRFLASCLARTFSICRMKRRTDEGIVECQVNGAVVYLNCPDEETEARAKITPIYIV